MRKFFLNDRRGKEELREFFREKGREKRGNLKDALLKKRREKEELKARGVIIKFYHFPNVKEQKEVVKRLKESGLKKTKSIKSFQTLLFEWEEGGLKPAFYGKRACEELEDLSSVKRCNPDVLLPLNHQNSSLLADASQKTEAGFKWYCPSCAIQKLQPVFIEENTRIEKNIRTCGLISDKQKLMRGVLSDYWAQELIGSDLLRDELKKVPPPERKNWITVFDTPEEDHNIYVKNLISDEGSHAVLPELEKPSSQVLSSFKTHYPGDYVHVAASLEREPLYYINNSMVWENSEDIYEAFKKLSPPAIVVIASGNGFPFQKLGNMKGRASKSFKAILVGSLSPYGFASDFSTSGEEVHILAPSDRWISSAGRGREYEKFGGTSGATPLVTGSLAGFEWLSGYHPTAEEAKVLLAKTAFPTLHSHEKPPINGVGMLNAYKLGEVGKRLKEKCKDKGKNCFKKEILEDENYHFGEDKSLSEDVKKVFPFCAMGKKLGGSLRAVGCGEKRRVFKKLRRAILLNPERSKDFLKSLSCIYREGGFLRNAEALNKLALALGSKEKVRATIKVLAEKERKKRGSISDEMLRLMVGMGGFEEELRSESDLERAVRMAGGVGKVSLPILERSFASGKPRLQKAAISAAGWMGEAGLPILERSFASGKPRLQEVAISAAGWMGEAGLPILERGFASGKLKLQESAIRAAGWIGKAGLPILERGFASGKLELQESAIGTAGWIGKAGLPILERGFASGKLELQESAIRAVGEIGEAGLPILERGFASGNSELQEESLHSAFQIGQPALPILKEVLKRAAFSKVYRRKKIFLDPNLRREINRVISIIEKRY